MKPLAFLGLSVLILTMTAFGQTEGGVVKVDLSSPYEIARLVNKNHGKQNSTVLELTQLWKRLGVAPSPFDQCGSDCTAKISAIDLDGKPGREVLLKLTGFSERCRFVVFSRRGKTWTVVGHVDHDFNRYEIARHRVVRFNGRPYLIIRGQEGSGSGFSLYFETWYQVGDTGLQSVLSHPVAGRTYPWPAGLGREFETHAITDSKSNSNLVLRYVVKYIKLEYGKNEQSEFFVNEHRATFQWAKQKNAFAFVPSHSNISEAEIEAIANIEDEDRSAGTTVGSMKFYSGDENKAWVGGGYEVFLKYNLSSLMEIARDKSNKNREWLRLFLRDCHDTAEKKALITAFERVR